MTRSVLYRRLPPPDAQWLRIVFLNAMRDTGVDVSDRRSKIIEHGHGAYSFVVWGDDALDCHAYPAPVMTQVCQVPAGTSESAIVRFLASEYATIFVEASPTPTRNSANDEARVRIATAALLTSDAIAIHEWQSHRVALVTPNTSELLRCGDTEAIFRDGITLVPMRA